MRYHNEVDYFSNNVLKRFINLIPQQLAFDFCDLFFSNLIMASHTFYPIIIPNNVVA